MQAQHSHGRIEHGIARGYLSGEVQYFYWGEVYHCRDGALVCGRSDVFFVHPKKKDRSDAIADQVADSDEEFSRLDEPLMEEHPVDAFSQRHFDLL